MPKQFEFIESIMVSKSEIKDWIDELEGFYHPNPVMEVTIQHLRKWLKSLLKEEDTDE